MMEVSGNGIGKKEKQKALQVEWMVKQRAGGGRRQRLCPDNHNHPAGMVGPLGKPKHWGQLRTVVGATATRLPCLKVRHAAPCAPSPPHCSPLCAGCSQRQPRTGGENFPSHCSLAPGTAPAPAEISTFRLRVPPTLYSVGFLWDRERAPESGVRRVEDWRGLQGPLGRFCSSPVLLYGVLRDIPVERRVGIA